MLIFGARVFRFGKCALFSMSSSIAFCLLAYGITCLWSKQRFAQNQFHSFVLFDSFLIPFLRKYIPITTTLPLASSLGGILVRK
jgi:hypothetical protein